MELAELPDLGVERLDLISVDQERSIDDHHVGQDPVLLQVDGKRAESFQDGLSVAISLFDDRRVRELPELDPLKIRRIWRAIGEKVPQASDVVPLVDDLGEQAVSVPE